MASPGQRQALDPWGCDSLVQNHPADIPVFSVLDRWPAETRPIEANDNHNPETDVAIIGGGVMGCGLAAHLIRILDMERVTIFEPGKGLLLQLYDRVRAIDQAFMRSPFYSHMAPDGDLSLLDVARLSWPDLTSFERNQVGYALGRQRALVSSDVFFRHANHVVTLYGLQDRTSRVKVRHVTREKDGTWRVAGEDGRVTCARVVILCMGGRPRHPTDRCSRQFDPFEAAGYRLAMEAGSATVVGGGISAFHAVTKLVQHGVEVQWRMRRPLEYRCFDFDPFYARREGQLWLEKATAGERAQALRREQRGSLPPELSAVLAREPYRSQVTIRVMKEAPTMADGQAGGEVTILATGLRRNDSVAIGRASERPARKGTSGESPAGLYQAGLAAANALGPAAASVEGIRLFIERNIEAIAHTLQRSIKRRSRFMQVTGHAAIT